tara:strand:+ start:14290 stop:14823 length:534 start_codon:yes stop_codon:yes gene_type:complete
MQNHNSKFKILSTLRCCLSLFAFRFEFKRGLTLIEIIIAISILLVISTLGLNAFTSFKKATDITSSSDTVLSQLIQARSKTLSAEYGEQYGVHFEVDRATFFKGATYSPSDLDNQELILPVTVEISSISLSGSGSDVLFKKLTGETDNDGTITMNLKSDTSKTRTIVIRETGLAFVQ